MGAMNALSARRTDGPWRRVVRIATIGALALSAGIRADVADDLPSVGDASSRLISPQMERQLGESFLKQVHAALPTVDDPILKYYVQRQLAGIVQYSELREPILATVLIDSDDINAFAAPGGIVGINLGLMLARPGRTRILKRRGA